MRFTTQVQGYAMQNKAQCGGMWCRKRCSAGVCSTTKGEMWGTKCRRGYSVNMRRKHKKKLRRYAEKVTVQVRICSEVRRAVEGLGADLRSQGTEELQISAGLYW